MLLNNVAIARKVRPMKHLLIPCTVALTLAITGPAMAAECYADYKAKQDSPLRLHYGVMQLENGCTRRAAKSEIATRLERTGWTLLNVRSVFGPEGLNERKGDAGTYFLRF